MDCTGELIGGSFYRKPDDKDVACNLNVGLVDKRLYY